MISQGKSRFSNKLFCDICFFPRRCCWRYCKERISYFCGHFGWNASYENIKFPKALNGTIFIGNWFKIFASVRESARWKEKENPWKESVNLVITFQRTSHLAYLLVSWWNKPKKKKWGMQFLNNKIVIQFEKFPFVMLHFLTFMCFYVRESFQNQFPFE